MRTKNKQINFRVTEKEFIALSKKCTISGMRIGSFLLYSALNKEIVIIDGLREFNSELRKIGVNLNQLTKLCNEGRLNCMNLGETKGEVNKIWLSLNSLIRKAV